MAADKSWMNDTTRISVEYINGLESFLDFAFNGGTRTDIRCPCVRCKNRTWKLRREVRNDCVKYGFDTTYTVWDLHGEVRPESVDVQSDDEDVDEMVDMLNDAAGGDRVDSDKEGTEEPNSETSPFYSLLSDAKGKLYPGCPLSKLSVIVKLLHWKSFHHVTNKGFDAILSIIRDIVPDGNINIPESCYNAKKYIGGLGLEYQKIHACPNDCILYRAQYANYTVCPRCRTSRYINTAVEGEDDDDKPRKKVPLKVLRYFSPIKRLQRLYSSHKTAHDMTWHIKKRVDDGLMRHPSDSPEWKSFDLKFPNFSTDPRNVRLALATDGFQPFGNLSSLHSIWPVILIPYNLPPWMCMKHPYFMLSLLIPGPKAPGMDIDVYLEPLIDDLKHLWEEGVDTFDAHRKQNFKMHAALLWTISDFPALADLSGWQTKGNLACPTCYDNPSHRWLKYSRKVCYMGHRRFLPMDDRRHFQKTKFDGTVEHNLPPREVTGDNIVEDLHTFTPVPHGKFESRKRKWDATNSRHHWRKRSIFFQLPYWRTLTIRHCLDVMHTEKNVSENIIGTLLNIKGKTKDTPNSRMDLKDLNIRKDLHLRPHGSTSKYMPPAIYTLDVGQRTAVFEMLKKLKTPDAYMSNISRCIDVTEKKLSGLKSHDYHILLQQLLPIMIKSFLRSSVTVPLIGLCSYYRNLCTKALKSDDLQKMEKQIIEILCGLEQVFPPSFFTSMVHVTVHLAREARITGPVQYRWMYPIERYLRRLKDFVRNKTRAKGSITEAYLVDECMTFCSRYLQDVDTNFNRQARNEEASSSDDNSNKLEVFKQPVRKLGASTAFQLSSDEFIEAHFFVLNNCDDVVNMRPEYDRVRKRRPESKINKSDFIDWIYERIIGSSNEHYHEGLISLARKPNRLAHKYSGCVVNGFRFNTQKRERRLKTYSSGVLIRGDNVSKEKLYYGMLVDVIEIRYSGQNNVVLFKCDWFNVKSNTWCKTDDYGISSVQKDHFLHPDDMFVFADQAEQVFYVEDLKEKGWYNVIIAQPRDTYNISEDVEDIDDSDFVQQEECDIQVNIYNNIIDLELDTLVNDQAEGEVISDDDIAENPTEDWADIYSDEEDDEVLESDVDLNQAYQEDDSDSD